MAAFVLCAFALLDGTVDVAELVEPVFAPDLDPASADAVVFAVALVVLPPVCFAVAEPAVITTGKNETSVDDSVAVVRRGIESLPESRPAPEAAAVQTAWVVPIS